jgi:hypothetical protein
VTARTTVLFEGVLGAVACGELWELASKKGEHFRHSRTSPTRLYPDWRRSTVLPLDHFADFAARIERAINDRLPDVLAQLTIPAFATGPLEIQLTSHNDGEYYRWHTDNGLPETASRMVTFVYYFHREPKPFSGGECVIYGSDGATTVIEPRNDSLLLFDASTKHEVKPVSCRSGRFEDGRFTLNGWVHRKRPAREEYFDAKIFGVPPVPEPQRPALAAHAPHVEPASQATAAASNAGERALAVLDLYSRLFRHSPQARTVDVRTQITADAFFADYYAANRPVLLKGIMADSPALQRWSPSFFARHHGSVPVRMTDARSHDDDYETNFSQHVRTTTLSDFVRRLAAEPESNDYYIVARNHFFEEPTLRPLRRDLRPPRGIIDSNDDGPGTVKLWFGPKGTVTPLHHDEHSILFAQVYGRKRFKLIPPFDGPRMYVRRRFFSAVDPERIDAERYPEFLKASVADVVVEPGDALFLPVGWWHWARALAISISATFCSFGVPGRNDLLRTPPG